MEAECGQGGWRAGDWKKGREVGVLGGCIISKNISLLGLAVSLVIFNLGHSGQVPPLQIPSTSRIPFLLQIRSCGAISAYSDSPAWSTTVLFTLIYQTLLIFKDLIWASLLRISESPFLGELPMRGGHLFLSGCLYPRLWLPQF